MSRARRKSHSPAARAGRLAGGLTLIWLAFAAWLALPLLLSPNRALNGTNVVICAAAGAVALLAWWRALAVARWQNAAGKRLDDLKNLSPDAFEEWVAARFRDLGYRVELTGSQGDHGVDLAVRKGDERAVVQVKNYKATSVGEPVLRDLYGAMHHANASKAYLVTAARLTQPAWAWIADKPIEVWDGDELLRLAFASPAAGVAQSTPAPAPAPTPTAAGATGVGAVICARCGAAMVERTNRQTGELFWGCSQYPRCRFTRPLV